MEYSTAENSKFLDVSAGAVLNNFFTGSLDYARELEQMAFQNQFNAEQASIERQFNATEAFKNRQFQEYLSNTAYQRGAEDMKKAGLNPYLAYNTAFGASTPSGATASSGQARSASPIPKNSGQGVGALLRFIGGIVGSAISSATATSISASKISAQEINNAMRNQTAMDVAKRNQYREIHHYNHKP